MTATKRPWEKSFAHLVPITFFPDIYAFSSTTKSLTLWDLRDLIRSTTATTKLKLPWLKLARFGDNRSDNKSLRWNENVISISGIEVDYDGEEMTFRDRARIHEAGPPSIAGLYIAFAHDRKAALAYFIANIHRTTPRQTRGARRPR